MASIIKEKPVTQTADTEPPHKPSLDRKVHDAIKVRMSCGPQARKLNVTLRVASQFQDIKCRTKKPTSAPQDVQLSSDNN